MLNLFDPFQMWYAPQQRSYSWTPRVTAHEDAGAAYFELEAPGFSPDDIKVTSDVDRGVLTITGQRRGREGKVDRSFERSFSIYPEEFDLAGVTTSVAHGLVTVTVPKRPPPPPSAVATRPSEFSLATTPTYDAASKMQWPPKFETADRGTELVYSSTLPTELTPENIDVHLERGGVLSVSVKAHVENVKKDDKGNVVHSESRTLQYSTPLAVPRGTVPADVAVTFEAGTLQIRVAKHSEGQRHSIEVKRN